MLGISERKVRRSSRQRLAARGNYGKLTRFCPPKAPSKQSLGARPGAHGPLMAMIFARSQFVNEPAHRLLPLLSNCQEGSRINGAPIGVDDVRPVLLIAPCLFLFRRS